MTDPVLSVEDVAWYSDDGPGMPAAVRETAVRLAGGCGFAAERVADIAIAATEVAEHVRLHADEGRVLLRTVLRGGMAGLELVTVDQGPGMRDVSAPRRRKDMLGLAAVEAVGTLGIGLGAVERLADAFDVHSVPGRGTVLTVHFWASGPPSDRLWCVGGITRPMHGETVCGDRWAARESGGYLMVMLCDGQGHGAAAAAASRAAVAAFNDECDTEPDAVMARLDAALRDTRGGAVCVVRIDSIEGRAMVCGVGDIAGALVSETSRIGLAGSPGVVGRRIGEPRTYQYPLRRFRALVLHTNGVTNRWRVDAMPGLLSRTPLVIAGQLLREAGVQRADAAVVVVSQAW
ncbi:SpoIIE family protein phosphatase [Wenjunlia tyrosinilytica]|uniref:Transcriptional regulator n=1 Tax=Wenjunlia tyrosinilytica TaxID=1544741 RepID=A0A917ZDE9_9ACTN|nr:SpoIIE family protein phosphatase [Wenjunlia tyrosinilytica]GGO80452.1 transcriptional regulator [Wenjunlia tyrosinilytica]